VRFRRCRATVSEEWLANGHWDRKVLGRRPAARIREPGDPLRRQNVPPRANGNDGLRRQESSARAVIWPLETNMKKPLIGASATLVLALVALPTAAACDPATHAIQYLSANQRSDGSLDMSTAGGFGNPGATMDFAMDVAATGVDPGTVHQPAGAGIYDYLAVQAPTLVADAGATAKLLLALAAGNNPPSRFDYHDFGGQDLLGKLTSASPGGFYHPGGTALGSYGNGATFTQALAILAAKATGGTPPPAALTWLKGLENQGPTKDAQVTAFTAKGWSTAASSNAAQGDTNSTAIALEALNSVRDGSRNAPALAWLHTQQNSDGGFPFETPGGYTISDPNSDAFVIQSLVATGENLSAWTISGKSPLTNLLTFQDSAGGGIGLPTPDTFTTALAVPAALAGRALPVAAAKSGATLPASGCQVAAASVVNPSPSPAPGMPAAGRARQPTTPMAPGLWATLAGLALAAAGATLVARRPG